MGFKESRVHPQEHAGPIAAFSASSTRVNAEKAVARVLWARKETLQFGLLAKVKQGGQVCFDGGECVLVRLLTRQFEQLEEIARIIVQFFNGSNE